MSTPSPRPPRRRIAGERRPVRPDGAQDPAEDAPDDTADETAGDTGVTTPAPATAAAESPGSDGPPPPPAPPAAGKVPVAGPSWPVVAAVGVLALLLVAAAVALGLGRWDYREVRDQDAVQAASRTAPAAAERASAAILSYDYETLDADEKAAERYMTAAYRKQYADTFDRLVRPNASKVKAKVEAEVKASGVAHADADRVNVLLYVNQTTTSTANGGTPQVALNRVQLSMVHQGDAWLVADITSY